MPDDDTMLAQGTVDFRNEGRRVFACDVDESAGLAFCTQDAQCGAEADQHIDGCPVEEQLTNEFGF